MPARWYRSLYWRIAIGFVLCLAAMLVVQAVLFVWAVSQAGPQLPGQPPDRFAQTVAFDLADELIREPDVDIATYLREQYGRDAHPYFVMMVDGGLFSNGGPFPDDVLRDTGASRGKLEQTWTRTRRWPDFAAAARMARPARATDQFAPGLVGARPSS